MAIDKVKYEEVMGHFLRRSLVRFTPVNEIECWRLHSSVRGWVWLLFSCIHFHLAHGRRQTYVGVYGLA